MLWVLIVKHFSSYFLLFLKESAVWFGLYRLCKLPSMRSVKAVQCTGYTRIQIPLACERYRCSTVMGNKGLKNINVNLTGSSCSWTPWRSCRGWRCQGWGSTGGQTVHAVLGFQYKTEPLACMRTSHSDSYSLNLDPVSRLCGEYLSRSGSSFLIVKKRKILKKNMFFLSKLQIYFF
jgi:hypothetical protein